VDGYGTITTPYGTFDVLRIKHDIDEIDSLYTVLPILGGTWIPLDIPVSHEYEWWTNGQKEPILRFKTNEIAGNEIVTSIEYRDSYRGLDAGIQEMDLTLAIFPNPTSSELVLSANSVFNFIEVFDIQGKSVKRLEIENTTSYHLNVSSLPAGQYKISTSSGNHTAIQSFVKE
jgi:hypothetical protein